MSKIKLFVCCHQPAPVPVHPLLVPVQVGAHFSRSQFPGFLQDNQGANISEKNRSYCELTAQYWAWKNVSADYYGFFHYRRYLYPDLHARVPYRICEAPTSDVLKTLDFDRFESLIPLYELIAPVGENMYTSVRKHYADAPFHHKSDLLRIEKIIQAQSPAFVPGMNEYFSGSICYFGNIYIMQANIFDDYCTWLFQILDAFDSQAELTAYSQQELRVDGYLAERLFGVYLTAKRRSGGLRIAELPRAHFITDDAERLRQRSLALLLPPGSRRRSIVKAIARKGL